MLYVLKYFSFFPNVSHEKQHIKQKQVYRSFVILIKSKRICIFTKQFK